MREGISSTAWAVGASFLATSAFRYWQLRANNKSLQLGLFVIFASYAPSYIYYRRQVSKETAFIRTISERYSDRIDNEKLEAFIGTLP